MGIRFLVFIIIGLGFWSSGSYSGIEPPILRISRESEPLRLDWNNSRFGGDRYVITLLMRGLLRYSGDSSNTPICDLCSGYKVSSDGKTYVFDLKQDVEWSDGVKLEARHFVESFHRVLDPANHFEDASEFSAIVGAIQSQKKWDSKKLAVKAEGKNRLEITLTRPLVVFPHLLTSVSVFPVRKEFLKKGSDNLHASSAVLGAYQLAAWEKGKRIVLEGNPKYTGERPVYRVEIVFGTPVDLMKRFKAGKLDIYTRPTLEDMMGNPTQRIQVNPYWATRTIYLNTKRKTMADLSLRKAILYALDRDALPAYLKNGERKATGLIPPGLIGYRELPLVTADLAKAMAERERVAPLKTPVEIDLWIRDSSIGKKLSKWITEQLEKVKITVRVKTAPLAEFVRGLNAGKFDIAVATWTFTWANPLDFLRTFKTGSPLNRSGWTHITYDDMISQLYDESKSGEFARLVDQATQILEAQGVAIIPIGFPTQPYLLGPRVNHFSINTYGDPDLSKIQLKQ